MPTYRRYCTLFQLKQYLSQSLSEATYDEKFRVAADEASRLIDMLLKPRFSAPQYFTDRSYDAAGEQMIRVLDLLELDSFKLDEDVQSYTNTAQFIFGPTDGPPYQSIKIRDNADISDFGSNEFGSVHLTAFYGFCEPLNQQALLAASIDGVQTTLTIPAQNLLDLVDRYWRLDDELLMTTALAQGTPNDTLSVLRGINGSLAAAHNIGAPLMSWEPNYSVRVWAKLIASRILLLPFQRETMLEKGKSEKFGGIITDQMYEDITVLAPDISI